MHLLFCGDIVGRSGREIVLKEIPRLRENLQLDCVIANAENSAHGFGVTAGICKDLYAAGVDIITGGNHIWDQKEIISYIDKDPRLLRALNYPPGTPGHGTALLTTPKGRKILVIHVMGRVFMDPLDDPFRHVDEVLKQHPLGKTVAAIVIDIHGEATAEKMALGHFCDGRASLVVGTHTHIPTADAQIFPNGTAYQTDAGMCGDYDSVIGMVKDIPIARMMRKLPTERLSPAQGPATFCGVYVETDDTTGLATQITPVRIGPRLQPSMP